MSPQVAVLIPCLNEERSIATVVCDFRRVLPEAVVYVCDNCSTDQSRALAFEAGAFISVEPRQGKGFAVRRMFREIEADVYLLVDGDDTYDASAAPAMLDLLLRDHLDMVIARRCSDQRDAWPGGHRTGNFLITGAVRQLFGSSLHDVLSGYRIFSRHFVKSFHGLAQGFEIETEITIDALTRGLPIREVETKYRARHEGSVSKLRTWHDGFRIARSIVRLFLNRRNMVRPEPREPLHPPHR